MNQMGNYFTECTSYSVSAAEFELMCNTSIVEEIALVVMLASLECC